MRVPRRSAWTRSAICCAIVPLGIQTAASLPSSDATRASSRSAAPPFPYMSASSAPTAARGWPPATTRSLAAHRAFARSSLLIASALLVPSRRPDGRLPSQLSRPRFGEHDPPDDRGRHGGARGEREALLAPGHEVP